MDQLYSFLFPTVGQVSAVLAQFHIPDCLYGIQAIF